jgi:hypothetical protein
LSYWRFIAQQFGGVQLEPGFDAFDDALGDFFHQLDGARVQLAAFFWEERDRHAPVALTRDAPVRTVGDHRVQARLAPGRDELGVFDGFERALHGCSPVVGCLSMPMNHCAVAR